jgi:hypothetical protein
VAFEHDIFGHARIDIPFHQCEHLNSTASRYSNGAGMRLPLAASSNTLIRPILMPARGQTKPKLFACFIRKGRS